MSEITNNQTTVPDMKDFSAVKSRLIPKLVNKLKAQGIVSSKYHDLFITYHFLVKVDEEAMITLPVTEGLLASWGISKRKLRKLSIQNAEKLLPPEISGINSILRGLVPEEELSPETDFFVCSNAYRHYGATVILYPGVLRKLYDDCGAYTIVPSSTHETLVYPDTLGYSIEDCKADLRNTNSSLVIDQGCYLGDNVYRYDPEKDDIYIA